MSIKYSYKGDLKKTENFLKKSVELRVEELETYGQQGVNALSKATPVDTGLTASSWYYEIKRSNNSVTIEWKNSNVVDGVPIALIIQLGHGTRNGAYVQGVDYINPALKPVFDSIANNAWSEINK